jgi:hypothetical protein
MKKMRGKKGKNLKKRKKKEEEKGGFLVENRSSKGGKRRKGGEKLKREKTKIERENHLKKFHH